MTDAPLTLADVAERLRAIAADLDRRHHDLEAMATAELWGNRGSVGNAAQRERSVAARDAAGRRKRT